MAMKADQNDVSCCNTMAAKHGLPEFCTVGSCINLGCRLQGAMLAGFQLRRPTSRPSHRSRDPQHRRQALQQRALAACSRQRAPSVRAQRQPGNHRARHRQRCT